MLSALRRLIHDDDKRAGRAFDLAVQWLIVVSLVASAVDTVPSLSGRTRSAAR